MEHKGKQVYSVTISYLINGNKASTTCKPEFIKTMMSHFMEDGATEVKIAHYFDKNNTMIK
jgi:hypothetical protein